MLVPALALGEPDQPLGLYVEGVDVAIEAADALEIAAEQQSLAVG